MLFGIIKYIIKYIIGIKINDEYIHFFIAFVLWQITWHLIKGHPVWQEELKKMQEYYSRKFFGE